MQRVSEQMEYHLLIVMKIQCGSSNCSLPQDCLLSLDTGEHRPDAEHRPFRKGWHARGGFGECIPCRQRWVFSSPHERVGLFSFVPFDGQC